MHRYGSLSVTLSHRWQMGSLELFPRCVVSVGNPDLMDSWKVCICRCVDSGRVAAAEHVLVTTWRLEARELIPCSCGRLALKNASVS